MKVPFVSDPNLQKVGWWHTKLTAAADPKARGVRVMRGTPEYEDESMLEGEGFGEGGGLVELLTPQAAQAADISIWAKRVLAGLEAECKRFVEEREGGGDDGP